MVDIKLYVACHKDIDLPNLPYIYPVQAGAAVSTQRFPNMLADSTGDNISDKNPSYCELTVQYWAWKNQTADYYGFMHYRRWLSFVSNTNKRHISNVYLNLTNDVLLNEGYSEEHLQKFINQYDILLPHGERTAETVYEKYRDAEHHYIEDLDLMIALIRQYSPEYTEAAEQYINGHMQYYYNMYVMNQKHFHQYCEWLFLLLERFDAINNWDKYGDNKTALRVNGYLAERLFGIWYTYQKMNRTIRTVELPYLYFAMGNKHDYYKMAAKNKLLPPGSKRKNLVKKIRG